MGQDESRIVRNNDLASGAGVPREIPGLSQRPERRNIGRLAFLLAESGNFKLL